jgi:hypothetical protein
MQVCRVFFHFSPGIVTLSICSADSISLVSEPCQE